MATRQRTLDLDSPRVVSAQLYEAMRLTDFCLVDLTCARPNVMFELGVRLAANALHPVVVCDTAFPTTDSQGNADVVMDQRDQLCTLLAAVPYTPYAEGGPDSYKQMVARHLELRRLYLHHRRQDYRDNDPEVVTAYEALTDRLIEQLKSTDDGSDSAFAEQIDQWRADADAARKRQ